MLVMGGLGPESRMSLDPSSAPGGHECASVSSSVKRGECVQLVGLVCGENELIYAVFRTVPAPWPRPLKCRPVVLQIGFVTCHPDVFT